MESLRECEVQGDDAKKACKRTAAEHDCEQQEFAAAGFEEVQEVARFHG